MKINNVTIEALDNGYRIEGRYLEPNRDLYASNGCHMIFSTLEEVTSFLSKTMATPEDKLAWSKTIRSSIERTLNAQGAAIGTHIAGGLLKY